MIIKENEKEEFVKEGKEEKIIIVKIIEIKIMKKYAINSLFSLAIVGIDLMKIKAADEIFENSFLN